MQKSKIYTKTGDRGTTGSFYGRMGKSDQLAEALGAIDELNSWIGICRSRLPSTPPMPAINNELKRIQTNLLIIGSGLAGSGLKIKSGETRRLEKLVDKLTGELPKLANFIYPVGELQIARAVCRRAEREVVKLMPTMPAIKQTIKYLNRLSDALFTMARWVNHKMGMKEEVWRT